MREKSYVELNNEVLVEGQFNADKDKEAVKKYFIDHVNVNMRWFHNLQEKVEFLVENNYWDKDLIDMYSFEEVKTVFKRAYSYKFRFKSYMSAFKFYNDYALKSDDKQTILERYEDRNSIVALFFGDGDLDTALAYVDTLMKQEYQAATPSFLNIGRARGGELVSCFLLECGDSLNDINMMNSTARQLSKAGGGVCINLTKTRAKGETLKGIENTSSGVVPVMKNLDQSFRHINQLGQRSGAAATYLNVFHADIEDFLETKKISADEDVRCATLSLGVVIPDKMIELAREDKPMHLLYPKNFYDTYGYHFDDIDITDRYEEIIENPNIRTKQISARKLLEKIAVTQFESGYPYIMFQDNVNNEHQLNHISRVKFSNLCSEITQASTVSQFGDYGENNDHIGLDISCNLGALNIANVMQNKSIETAVEQAVKALIKVSDSSSMKNAPGVKRANEEMHSVGLGTMNLHGYLASAGIPYESDDAIEFVDNFYSAIRYYALRTSMLHAKETGETFYKFEGSGYADGSFFHDYLENKYPKEIESDKVKEAFEGIQLPTRKDWERLAEDVQEYGLYNAYLLAQMPTGSVSYIQSATAGAMPIEARVENRTYGNSKTFYPMPDLSPKNWFLYKEAYDMDMMKVIDLVATIQKHIDQAISFELFVNDTITTRELTRLQMYAHHKGIKTLYYIRQKNKAQEECLSCAV